MLMREARDFVFLQPVGIDRTQDAHHRHLSLGVEDVIQYAFEVEPGSRINEAIGEKGVRELTCNS